MAEFCANVVRHRGGHVFICYRNRFSFRGNPEMSQMRVKHRSDDPPGVNGELVRVVDLYRIRVVFLETRRGLLRPTRRPRARGRES